MEIPRFCNIHITKKTYCSSILIAGEGSNKNDYPTEFMKMKEDMNMKNVKSKIAAGLLALSMFSTSGLLMATEVNVGSAAALADTSYTLEEMLHYAIQDEYAAQAEYQTIQNEFGAIRVYTNIMKAEGKHIQALLPLFETYEITVPVDSASEKVMVPGSLSESYEIGVQAELSNIAMYEAFLKEELPGDVRLVFENLKKASENHLTAFQRTSQGQIGVGTMQARQANQNTAARGSSYSESARAQRLHNQGVTQGLLQSKQTSSQNGGGSRGNNMTQQRQWLSQNQTCLVNPQ